jgi:hypothetical protein
VSPSVKRRKESRSNKSNQTGAGKKIKKNVTGIKKKKASKTNQTGAGNTSTEYCHMKNSLINYIIHLK